MHISNDLSSHAHLALDRAADTGRGLVGTAGGLVGTAGSLAAEAGEAGERFVRAGTHAVEHAVDEVADATASLAPAVRATARGALRNRLVLLLLGLALVGLVVAAQRRRREQLHQRRLRSVTLVSEPAPEPSGASPTP